jgi:hypothetical protein
VLPARSIARPVLDLLVGRPFQAQVLAVFERACLLATPRGDIVSLVLWTAGDGPLNLVVAGEPGAFDIVSTGMPARLQDEVLTVGEIQVPLARAAVWEPRPGWERQRSRGAGAAGRLEQLRALALARAPRDSLLVLLAPGYERTVGLRPEVETVRSAAAELASGRPGEAARRLAGLGGGLTPAGDDFLCGAMLRAWLDVPAPGAFCQAVLAGLAQRTTLLSTALLRAAARGECSAAWHRLLDALAAGAPLTPAVDAVLAHGHTSGADTLAGFLSARS